MAKRISQLPEETSVATGDQIPIYDASTGTTKRATVTNMLAGVKDGTLIANDAILARHINWAGTGADGGIWWEELGRTTLGVAGDTISVTPIGARKYLRVLLFVGATAGTIHVGLRVNNDSAANYALRYSNNGAADTIATANTYLTDSGTIQNDLILTADIINILAEEKLCQYVVSNASTAGAANAPNRQEGVGKWANTAAQITRIDALNTGTGNFAIGSELIVLGHD